MGGLILKATVFKNNKLSYCSFTANILDAALVKNCDFSGSLLNIARDITNIKTRDIDNLNIFHLESLSGLSKLWIQNTLIADLRPLQCLPNLRELFIHNTPISDLSFLQSIVQLNKLEILHLHIHDLSPLQHLTHLKELWLYSNNIMNDLSPLYGLTELKHFKIRKKQVSDTQIQALQSALPSLKIVLQ